MISRLGRLLAETGTATPQAVLEQATRPGRSAGTLARALEDFFTDAGLAFPRRPCRPPRGRTPPAPHRGDPRTAAASRSPLRRRPDYRSAAGPASRHPPARRSHPRRRPGRPPRPSLFLADRQGKTDWAIVQAADLEAFLAVRPASRAQRLTTIRSFFRWARASRLVLANPAAGIRAGRPRGYHPRTLAVTEQRRLFRRWTTDPAVHPHEALTGLLALLHAAPSQDLRNLKVTDIDATARTIRLGRRPHPVPLDPASWHALQRCLEHREQLATRNPHVIVTTHTRTRRTAASDQYLVRVLDPAGIGTRTLRATRLVDLVASLDPKLVCEALGMDPPASCPTRLTRSKTSGSPTCELQAPPCTRCLERMRFAGVVDNGLHSQRAVLLQVDLDPRVLEGQVHRDLVAAVQQPGGEGPRGLAGDPGGEDDLHMLRAAQVDVAGQQLLKDGPDPARVVEDQGAGDFDLPHGQLLPAVVVPVGTGQRQREAVHPGLEEHPQCPGLDQVAQLVQPGRIRGGGEPVGQRRHRDALGEG
jgi:hypothetical protein